MSDLTDYLDRLNQLAYDDPYDEIMRMSDALRAIEAHHQQLEGECTDCEQPLGWPCPTARILAAITEDQP